MFILSLITEGEGVERLDDKKIVCMFLQRDESALREVSKKYGAYCTAIAHNILHNNEDAEECVNDTYMHAWNSIPPNKPAKLGAFLGRITKNLALNKVDSLRCEKRGGRDVTVPFEELDEFISGNVSIENECEFKEMIAEINVFLQTLPAKKRMIFVARYWQCDKLSEIAECFGMAESGVATSLSRTCQKLRDHLKRRGFDV